MYQADDRPEIGIGLLRKTDDKSAHLPAGQRNGDVASKVDRIGKMQRHGIVQGAIHCNIDGHSNDGRTHNPFLPARKLH
jgi:hypothetical protein